MRSLRDLHFAACVTFANPWSLTDLPQVLQTALPSTVRKWTSIGLSIEPCLERRERRSPRCFLFWRLMRLVNHLQSLFHRGDIRSYGVRSALNLGHCPHDLGGVKAAKRDGDFAQVRRVL